MDQVPAHFPSELGHRLPPVAWQPDFVDHINVTSPVGRHPGHEAGHFYSLDLSSVFAASLALALSFRPRSIMDVCASPGGKSLFAWRAFQPEIAIANECIHSRIRMLRENLTRCGAGTIQITQLDPHRLAARFANLADLVLVDAPCSGQSMPAKGIPNPGCFHPVNVKRNALRQRRILADAAGLVQSGGALLYSTCTFSLEENEKNTAWFLKHFPDFIPVASPLHAAWQSKHAGFPAYRLHPHEGLGTGAYAVLLSKTKAA